MDLTAIPEDVGLESQHRRCISAGEGNPAAGGARWVPEPRRSPRMIQEEKESTELRAEELETRVTSGSMEGLNLTQLCKRASIPTSLTALSLASSSPPLSGRSTPKLSSRSAAQDLNRMGIMTLVRRWRRWGYWTGGAWVPGVGAMPRHLQGCAAG